MKRKEIELLQDLDLSLKFKDYAFLSERVGLSEGYIKLIFKTKSLKFEKYLPLLKQAVREQLLRDVCNIS
jgi:hypothetical protein